MLKACGRLAALLLPCLMLAACSAGQSGITTGATSLPEAGATAGRSAPVRIAMLLPLSGFDQSAVIGKGMKQAGELALFEINNPNIQLLVKDDKGTPEGARLAAEEAIRDGAEIIVGPLTSQTTVGAAPAARLAKVPILSFSNDHTVAGNGVYLMSFMAQQEVERIVSYAAAQGKRSFAALIPADAYGRVVEPAFRAAVARAGGTIAMLQSYPPGANALIDPARKLVEGVRQSATGAPVEAVLLAGGPAVLPRVTPLFTYSGVDTKAVQLLGTGAWEYPNIGRDPVLAGGLYPGPDPQSWREFSGRFAKSFGTAPPRLASLAYDAVGFAVALSTAPQGERFSAASITRPSGYNGVDGMLRFNAQGIAERSFAVLEVQSYGTRVVEPARGSFEGATQMSAAPSPRPN